MTQQAFQVRGVVEGFYGVYYTYQQRNDLLRFIGGKGFNLYVYVPKNDRQHRVHWKEPYPQKVLGGMAEIARNGFYRATGEDGSSGASESPEDFDREYAGYLDFSSFCSSLRW